MSLQDTIEHFKELKPEDLRILSTIELNMSRYQHVPFDEIQRYTEKEKEELQYWLSRLRGFQLIKAIWTPGESYALNYAGYDCLAINALLKRGILEALGPSLGVGKEADVFAALTPQYESIVLKLHRLGRTSFHHTRRHRGYVADRRHISWLYQSRLAAEREYEALQRIYPTLKLVPEPISQNRHAVAMSLFPGDELTDIPHLKDPRHLLDRILEAIRKIYSQLGIIHSDLSAYNVLVDEEEDFVIIDWPQYVTRDHPDARRLIERDIRILCRFFSRKFSVETDIDKELVSLTE